MLGLDTPRFVSSSLCEVGHGTVCMLAGLDGSSRYVE